MELIFLGTSSMVPTKERNHTGIFLTYKDEGLLFDCGENIQRQMKVAGIGLNKITRIFISHLDGDHVLGLPGMFLTMKNSGYNHNLRIYGPKGIKRFMDQIIITFGIAMVEHEVVEVSHDTIVETREYFVEAFPLEHTKACLAYAFTEKDRVRINMAKAKKLGLKEGPMIGKLQSGKSVTMNGKKISTEDVGVVEKGKKIAVVMDTLPCTGCLHAAKDADVLIIESSFESSKEEKAQQYKHMTAKKAAEIALQANVKRLYLTHFSQRYKDVNVIKEEAETLFQPVVLAHDFLKVKL